MQMTWISIYYHLVCKGSTYKGFEMLEIENLKLKCRIQSNLSNLLKASEIGVVNWQHVNLFERFFLLFDEVINFWKQFLLLMELVQSF